jgi:hypothetical protein
VSQNILPSAKNIGAAVGSLSIMHAYYSLSLSNDWAGIHSAALSLLFRNAPSQSEIGGVNPAKHDFCIRSDDFIARG